MGAARRHRSFCQNNLHLGNKLTQTTGWQEFEVVTG